MTSSRADRCAMLLIQVREGGRPLQELPTECRPGSADEAYEVQDAVARHLDRIGGWKVGAPSPEAEPAFAPMFASVVVPSPATFRGPDFRLFGIEGELAFRLAEDLPPRDRPYTRDDIVGAVAALHPAIEVVESRFGDFQTTERFSVLADNQSNGGFVYGAAIEDWQSLDLVNPPITVRIDGIEAARSSGNKGGDPLRLVTALANHLTARRGGLRAGDFITTGSCTGVVFAKRGATVVTDFGPLGQVSVSFPS